MGIRKLDEIRSKICKVAALASAVAAGAAMLPAQHEQLQVLANCAEECSSEALSLVDQTIASDSSPRAV